ncbi:hypothetical protein E4U46_003070 [Claviceps purpurea]|nr:hypothetical protein E4U36_003257 [Claviceps purpurea]KAG6194413.1 hypothetical protein E4U10_002978 [Claviceps purpurea]KAG6214349.1 hypothetical protein E4U26_000431 [Claviceps purpurea]KAG6288749.1 hypothetical protein E4U46_003070 [Claviceps purpurea]KAG6294606.1 hypothetical protein E4U45_006317 [Claviceps purpurea]
MCIEQPWDSYACPATSTYLPKCWAEFARSVLSKIDDPNITANRSLANKALNLAFRTLEQSQIASKELLRRSTG